MHTAVDREPRALRVVVDSERITATLADGRVIGVPLWWSWRLERATPEQRANYRILGDGEGFHWPDVDEDISVEGMLRGTPAPRPAR
jgi:hypothetical protein